MRSLTQIINFTVCKTVDLSCESSGKNRTCAHPGSVKQLPAPAPAPRPLAAEAAHAALLFRAFPP